MYKNDYQSDYTSYFMAVLPIVIITFSVTMLCTNMFTERSKVVEKHVQNVTINFGPQHPAAHGVLRLVLTLDGEVGKTIYIV